MRSWIALSGAALALTVASCGFSTANISAATLATDRAGEHPTTTFTPDQPFYAVVDLSNAVSDTETKAVWTAVDVDATGAKPDTVIDEASMTHGSGQIVFDLTNDGPWPTGSYKVDIFLNEDAEPAKTLELEVR